MEVDTTTADHAPMDQDGPVDANGEEDTQLTIVTSDDRKFTVWLRHVKCCQTIVDLIDDVADDECDIPLIGIDGDMFEHIHKICKHHYVTWR